MVKNKPKGTLVVVPVHSVLPPITNSSSELFVMQTDKTVDEVKSFLNLLGKNHYEAREILGNPEERWNNRTFSQDSMFGNWFDERGALIHLRFQPPEGLDSLCEEIIETLVSENKEYSKVPLYEELAVLQELVEMDYWMPEFKDVDDPENPGKKKRAEFTPDQLKETRIRYIRDKACRYLKKEVVNLFKEEVFLSYYLAYREAALRLKKIVENYISKTDFSSSTFTGTPTYKEMFSYLVRVCQADKRLPREGYNHPQMKWKHFWSGLVRIIEFYNDCKTLEEYMEVAVNLHRQNRQRAYWCDVHGINTESENEVIRGAFVGLHCTVNGQERETSIDMSTFDYFKAYFVETLWKDKTPVNPLDLRFVSFVSAGENSVPEHVMDLLRSIHPSVTLLHAG